jgi:hypothetical protein
LVVAHGDADTIVDPAEHQVQASRAVCGGARSELGGDLAGLRDQSR